MPIFSYLSKIFFLNLYIFENIHRDKQLFEFVKVFFFYKFYKLNPKIKVSYDRDTPNRYGITNVT